MPLESLNSEQINIHNLNLEEEKKPVPESERLYKELKKTKLYGANKEWGWSISPDGTLNSSDRHTAAQLLGILVESEFSNKSVQEPYENLKKTSLYNKGLNYWNNIILENGTPLVDCLFAEDQLLNILVELKYNRSAAKENFESLKKTELYDDRWKQWNWSMENSGEERSSLRDTADQLLSILIESQFDKKLAQKSYNALRKTKLYDEEKRMWHTDMNENQSLNGADYATKNQLLGVLVEAQSNKELAKEQYQTLKETPLYDRDKELWNYAIDEDQTIQSPFRNSGDQLLGILCEKEFEEDTTDLNNPTTPLPETRNY